MAIGWILVPQPPVNVRVRWERRPRHWVEVRTAANEGFEVVDSTGFAEVVSTLDVALELGYERQASIDDGLK